MIRILIFLLLASASVEAQQAMFLRGAAAGAAVQPDDVADLELWLKPEAGITIDVGVSEWVDQSANAYTLSQAITANQPGQGAVTLNGYSSIDFDGTNDHMTSTIAANSLMGGGENVSVFAVIRTATGTPNTLVGSEGASSNRLALHTPWSDNEIKFNGGNNGGAQLVWAGTFAAAGVLTLVRASADMQIRKDGATVATKATASGTMSNVNNMYLGMLIPGANYFSGELYELIIYSRGLSASEITDVETYLNDKYSIY